MATVLALTLGHRALLVRPADGLLVEVAGAVPRPGVHLVATPTIGAALTAAGRTSGDATPWVGGSRVVLAERAIVTLATDPLRMGHRVDVNRQAADVIEALPGVGPATAGAILDHRARSPFRAVEELSWVRGIGPAKLADLRPLVGVGDVPPRPPRQPVDLNAASAADLERLPGIGPTRAAAIVADRDAHGPYADLAALDRVPGIGPATIARLQDRVVAR